MTSVTQIPPLVTIFGGSGFIGRHLCQAGWAAAATASAVAVCNPNVAHHLQPLAMSARSRRSRPICAIAARSIARCRAPIASSIWSASLQESGKQRFDAIQAEGARAVAEAAQAVGARLVPSRHRGRSEKGSESVYARSKRPCEGGIPGRTRQVRAVGFRYSIVFGPEDDFFNRFANTWRAFRLSLPLDRWGPPTPLPAGRCDRGVAEAIFACRRRKGRGRPGHELGGPPRPHPSANAWRSLEVTQRKRLLLPLPWALASLMGQIFQICPSRS